MLLCTGWLRSAGRQKKAGALPHILICISLISFMAIPAQAATTPTPQVSAGYNHTLALRSDGTVWGWGDNYFDQLGQGASSAITFPEPVAVTGLTGTFTAVAAGDEHSLALRSDDTVWAWGQNNYGQLGDTVLDNDGNYITYSDVPVQVTGLTNIKAIAAGAGFSMALDTSGNVWVWGRNDSGQLGNGTSDTYTIDPTTELPTPTATQFKVLVTPTKIKSLSNITGIAAGGYHALAVDNTHTVWAWGLDGCGQLGDGVTVGSDCITATTPVVTAPKTASGFLSGLSVSSVAAGSYHSLAIMSDGSVEAWGANGSGQLGNNSTTDSPIPVVADTLTGVTSLAGGSAHSVALSGTAVSTWGSNYFGQLGNGNESDSDVPISSVLSGAAGVTAGEYFTVAWKSDGTVWAWGDNSDGQLGNGTYDNTFGTPNPTPAQVPSFSLTTLLGDMNGDGKVTAADALLALRIAVGLVPSTPAEIAIGDLNGDGKITAADALLILRKAVGL